MKWTIKRSKWMRGVTGSKLLTDSGMQCCIGQVCTELGVGNGDLNGEGDVAELLLSPDAPVNKLLPILYTQNGRHQEADWLRRAYPINDDPTLNDRKREFLLNQLAAANGHEFEFVD